LRLEKRGLVVSIANPLALRIARRISLALTASVGRLLDAPAIIDNPANAHAFGLLLKRPYGASTSLVGLPEAAFAPVTEFIADSLDAGSVNALPPDATPEHQVTWANDGERASADRRIDSDPLCPERVLSRT
jgi:hypothetical protein